MKEEVCLRNLIQIVNCFFKKVAGLKLNTISITLSSFEVADSDMADANILLYIGLTLIIYHLLTSYHF